MKPYAALRAWTGPDPEEYGPDLKTKAKWPREWLGGSLPETEKVGEEKTGGFLARLAQLYARGNQFYPHNVSFTIWKCHAHRSRSASL